MALPFADRPYRPCAGVMLANREGLVFVGQRLDTSSEAWQMPQGGIDDGEDARTAALRELGEETGIAPDLVTIIGESADEYLYDLPEALADTMWKARYRGQRQRWFLMRFHGDDSAVNIATAHPEFRAWKWEHPDYLESLIVPFKRALYRGVIDEFRPLI